MSKPTNTFNQKWIDGGQVYVVRSEDNIINVRTSLGATTIYLPNITSGSDSERKLTINDTDGQAGTYPITLVRSPQGSNLINGNDTLPLSVNLISAKILIVNSNEYLASLSTDNNEPPTAPVWGTITGNITNQSDVQNATIQGTFTPSNSVVVTNDTFKVAFQKLQGQISSFDLTGLWSKTGNTLTQRGVFGSISGVYGVDIKLPSGTIGGWENDGKFFWGTTSAFASTDFSIKGSGNTSGSYGLQLQNSDNSKGAWWRNDGVFNSNEYYIEGSSFARYSNGNAIIQMTPETGSKLSAGTDWVALGRFAMFNASGPARVMALGGNAFVNATTWSDSLAVGYRAGNNNTTGSYLMYLGPESGYYNETGDHQIMIGRSATPVSGATALSGVTVIASGGVVRQSNTGIFGSNDSPITRYVLGRGESETTTFEDVYITAHYPANNSNQNAGGSNGIAPPQARGTGTSGKVKIYYSPAVGSGTTLQTLVDAMEVEGATGNVGFRGSSYGSGVGVMFLANAGTNPSTAPVGGSLIYADNGAFSIKSNGNTSATFAQKINASDSTLLHYVNNAGDVFANRMYILNGSPDGYFTASNGNRLDFSINRNPLDGVFDQSGSTGAYFSLIVGSSNSSSIQFFTSNSNGATPDKTLELRDGTNIGFMAGSNSAGSYGGGAGVIFIANAGTDVISDPTGGFLIQAKSGTFLSRTSSGSVKTLHGDYQSKSATYTALITDEVIECTANTFTVDLYTAVGNKGRVLTINNQGTGAITVDANSTETINGSLTQTLNQYDSLTIVSNGNNWTII